VGVHSLALVMLQQVLQQMVIVLSLTARSVLVCPPDPFPAWHSMVLQQ
jgi:hypothetical protein